MTIARQYYNNHVDSKILFFSTPLQLDNKIINQSGIVTHHEPLPFYYRPQSFLEYVRCGFYAVHSFFTAIRGLWSNKSDRLITTGGICAIPVVCAAFCLAIPVDMYVLDAVPGKALMALAPFATNIYCCFESAKNYFTGSHVFSAPYPVRYLYTELDTTKENACHHLGLDPLKKTIFVLGGSQGSTFLNEILLQWVCDNPGHAFNTNIIHQYGNDKRYEWNKWYFEHNIQAITFDYASDLHFFYAAADVVIARAGAGTIFELQAFGKKTILIPLLADSTDHQIDNAQSIVAMYPDLFSFLLQNDVVKNRNCLYKKIDDLLG